MITKSSPESVGPRAWPRLVLWSLWLAVAVTVVASPVRRRPRRRRGYVSVFLDHVPNRDATELRARAFAEEKIEAGPHVRLTASGFVEGLLADRGGQVTRRDCGAAGAERRVSREAVRSVGGPGARGVGPARRAPADRRHQPDRRLAVLLRGAERGAAGGAARPRARFRRRQGVVEGVYVAVLPPRPLRSPRRTHRRRSTSSPARLLPGDRLPGARFVPNEPATTAANAQGGARVNVTSGRVDWSVSAYRGFRPFGIYTLSSTAAEPPGGAVDRVPAIHDDRRRRRDGSGPVGRPRRGGGVRARRVPGAGRGGRADGAVVRCRRRRRSQGGELPRSADRSSSTIEAADPSSTARADGRVADRVGGSHLFAPEVPGPAVRRLQSQQRRGVRARHRDGDVFATTSRWRARSAGSPARAWIRSAASPTATSFTCA